MMKKQVVVIALIFISIVCNSQITFQKYYGGEQVDIGTSVEQLASGEFITCGYTRSFGNTSTKLFLSKLDENGDSIWLKTYGEDFMDGATFCTTQDGGYVVAGSMYGTPYGNKDMCIVKTNVDGDSIWSKSYGALYSDRVFSIQQTNDAGYIIAGITSYSIVGSPEDIYLLKTDMNGDTLWTQIYGGNQSDIANSVLQTPDGGYIIAGSTTSYGAGLSDIYIVKTDELGNAVWTKTFGGSESDVANSIQQTNDGGFIVVGYSRNFGPATTNVYLLKMDSNGNELWSRSFSSGTYNNGKSVRQTDDGGFIITGYSYAGIEQLCLIKTDNLGNEEWYSLYGGTGNECGYSAMQTADNGYVAIGYTTSYGEGNNDIYIIKTNEEGIITSTENRPSVKEINAYPNPANDYIILDLQENSKSEVEIYDVYGKKVLSTFLDNGSDKVNIGELKSGFFLVKIKLNKTTYISKFLKM